MENIKKSKHYVSNQKLLEDLSIYKKKLAESKTTNSKPPRLSNYIGECIMLIAENLATMPKFSGYTFIDEMKSDGVENVCLYIDNFDPDKYNNPFAYITKIIYYAFLRRIAKEKKHLYVKYKSAANYGIFEAVTNTDPDADSAPFEMFDNLVDFIEEFERKKDEKKVAKKSKTKGVENFMENE